MNIKFIFLPSFFILMCTMIATYWFTSSSSSMPTINSSNEIAMESYEKKQLGEGAQHKIRDYYAPITENEKKDIRFIIITLATKSQFSLLFEKRALDQAGNRISHIHPLKMLSYIFTDNELKYAVKKIRGIPWRRFAKGLGESLDKSAKRKNLTQELIADFTQTVGVNSSLISPSAEKGRWEDLINITRNNLT